MIPRYSTTNIDEIWSDERKFARWLEIEKLVAQEWAKLELFSKSDAEIIANASFDIDKIQEYEKQTRHDFAAFIDVVTESVGEAGRWIHYGLTSSDVIDTALSCAMRDSLNEIESSLEALHLALSESIQKFGKYPMVGRTHGQHAESITFGIKAGVWLAEIERDLERLEQSRERIAVGKISGTVGSYATIPAFIESNVCSALGLNFQHGASRQIVNRDAHAEFVWLLALIATSLDSIATQIRLLSSTEIGEVAESFSEGQKGSSAMPHKQNPVRCERISGLARIARSYVSASLENTVLWHERDISHSSAERLMLPDITSVVNYMLIEMTDIINNLVVNKERAADNLELTNGLINSHKLMLALINRSMSRQDAYRIVQDLSFKSYESQTYFKDLVLKDSRITNLLTEDEIVKCF